MSEDAAVPVDATLQPNPSESGVRRVFFGRDGLRAGWCALLFLVVYAALAALVSLIAHFLLHLHAPDPKLPASPVTTIIGEGMQVLLVFAATWIMSRIEGRSTTVYGYGGQKQLSRFAWGWLWGFVALSALVLALRETHLLVFDAGHLAGSAAWRYGALWLLAFVLVGIFEESLLRGYLQFTLARGVGFWWGALILSILFGLIHGHNKGETLVGLFAAGAVGLVFCISLWYTGSLWFAIGMHAAWDWAETFFYGTSDSGMVAQGHLLTEHPTGPVLWSGGPTGPEGSLWIFPLLIVMALAMWLWWGRLRPARTISARSAAQLDTNAANI